jgi:hypothetical protein
MIILQYLEYIYSAKGALARIHSATFHIWKFRCFFFLGRFFTDVWYYRLLFDQCCSVRNYSFVFPQYLTANFSGLNSFCPSRNLQSIRPEQVHWTFLDAIFQRFRAENPAEGCLALNQVNERSLNALNSLYRTCHLRIYGEKNNGYPCKLDSDCLTSCNLVSRTCVIPWADPLGAFVKVHKSIRY